MCVCVGEARSVWEACKMYVNICGRETECICVSVGSWEYVSVRVWEAQSVCACVCGRLSVCTRACGGEEWLCM